MAKYGPNDISIDVDNTGGTPVTMDAYIDDWAGADVEAILEESHTFNDAWVEQLYSGIQRMSPITMSGFYDDTATTGPDAIFNALGETRTVTITWGGSKTTATEAIISQYTRTPGRNASTRFTVTLTPTGTVTEA
jgi:hypothetical protein|tara:strand:- start:11963 stop:12367 length:405 start_codon:yes stop_codon:yes gene_type:complete